MAQHLAYVYNKNKDICFRSDFLKKFQHIQRTLNQQCRRQQLISLHEIIKYVFNINLVYNLIHLITIFTVYLADEDVNKTSTP